ATVRDPAGAASGSRHYTVTSIDRGAGYTLDTSSGGSDGSFTGPFTVTGAHTYAEEGSYTVTVVLNHEGVGTTQTTTATVSDPAVDRKSVVYGTSEGRGVSGTIGADYTCPDRSAGRAWRADATTRA